MNNHKEYDNDRIYEKHKDLCSSKFKNWYMKLFYYMPEKEIDRIAEKARKIPNEENAKKTFSKMLKAWQKKYI